MFRECLRPVLGSFWLCASIASAATPITWNLTTPNLTALRGTVTTVPVGFTSSIPLYNVILGIQALPPVTPLTVSPTAPSLIPIPVLPPSSAPQISVFPSALSSVPAATPQALTITIIIPKTFQGPPQQLELLLVLTAQTTPDGHFGGPVSPVSLTLQVTLPSATTIPPSPALPSPDRIAILSSSNIQYVTDELDIYFQPGTNQLTIEQVVQSIGGTFLGSIPALNMYQLEVPAQSFSDLTGRIEAAETSSSVTSAVHHLFSNYEATFPNDPGAAAGIDALNLINLPAAWNITIGSKSVKVAVIDGEFDLSHPDFDTNLSGFLLLGSAGLAVTDPHGTRVASIIGATANNHIGIAGVMWNVGLYLYGTAIVSTPASNDNVAVQSAVVAAVANNVSVINYSAGVTCAASVCTIDDVAALKSQDGMFERLIAYAQTQRDVTWVIAAADHFLPLGLSSPARLSMTLPNVISVGAVYNSGQLASFSSYASTTYAPGVQVYSDVPGGSYNGTCDKTECTSSGTSFAAPFVAGVAGLMLSVNPTLRSSIIKGIIQATAKHSGNFDPLSNEVRVLDAYAAVQAAESAVGSWLSFVSGNPGVPGDGITIPAIPDNPGGAFTPSPFVSLANVTNGFTVAEFPIGGVQNGFNLDFGLVATNAKASCQGFGSGFGLSPSGTVMYHGVEGLYGVVSQTLLNFVISYLNSQNPTCSFTLGQFSLNYMFFGDAPGGVSVLDAASYGAGPYAFPVGVALTTTGLIFVITDNAAATFTITGPATFFGAPVAGGEASFPDAPPGVYTITFGAVPGFITPPSETLTLTAGGSIAFDGSYK